MKIPKNEVGALICRCDKGAEGSIRLSSPLSVGTPKNVRIRGQCPPRCTPIGTVHTHPGGPVRLSTVDGKSLAKHNLPLGCVTDGRTMRCYLVKKQ